LKNRPVFDKVMCRVLRPYFSVPPCIGPKDQTNSFWTKNEQNRENEILTFGRKPDENCANDRWKRVWKLAFPVVDDERHISQLCWPEFLDTVTQESQFSDENFIDHAALCFDGGIKGT